MAYLKVVYMFVCPSNPIQCHFIKRGRRRKDLTVLKGYSAAVYSLLFPIHTIQIREFPRNQSMLLTGALSIDD